METGAKTVSQSAACCSRPAVEGSWGLASDPSSCRGCSVGCHGQNPSLPSPAAPPPPQVNKSLGGQVLLQGRGPLRTVAHGGQAPHLLAGGSPIRAPDAPCGMGHHSPVSQGGTGVAAWWLPCVLGRGEHGGLSTRTEALVPWKWTRVSRTSGSSLSLAQKWLGLLGLESEP